MYILYLLDYFAQLLTVHWRWNLIIPDFILKNLRWHFSIKYQYVFGCLMKLRRMKMGGLLIHFVNVNIYFKSQRTTFYCLCRILSYMKIGNGWTIINMQLKIIWLILISILWTILTSQNYEDYHPILLMTMFF